MQRVRRSSIGKSLSFTFIPAAWWTYAMLGHHQPVSLASRRAIQGISIFSAITTGHSGERPM